MVDRLGVHDIGTNDNFVKNVKTNIDTRILKDGSTPSEKYSGWKWNFFIVGLLVLVMLAAFFWQVQKTRRSFLHRVTEHSRMIAGMVSFSLKNAKHSQAALEKTIHSFLVSKAKFADYLDSVEPFTAEELSAFASESTLVGIKLIHYDEVDVEGPPGWSPDISCEPGSSSLLYYPESKLYLIVWPTIEPGCILVGYDSTDIDLLMKQIGFEQLMDDMTKLSLIEYIRLEKGNGTQNLTEYSRARLIREGGRQIAESQVQFDPQTTLVVGVDASRYVKRIQQLSEEFFLFSILLIALGGFFSWLISRYQASFLGQVQVFEREMARQHEEAALGRAVATISHEIKNPLNAISMGLQRLQMELAIPEEHKNLITSMRQAVHRTNNIVTDLKQYTQPISLQYREVSPAQLVGNSLTLYKEKCRVMGISVTHENAFQSTLRADEALLGQVIENVLKNAIEAQPGGGQIDIITQKKGDMFVLVMENPGFGLDTADVGAIVEPYFTSKTQGTGLGLDVSRRIIERHGGTIVFDLPAQGVLRVTIAIPIRQV